MSCQYVRKECCVEDILIVKQGTQSTKHAPHARMPVPRRSQFCKGLPHSAALCAALSVSGSLFTTLDKETISSETVMAQLDCAQ